MPSAINNILMSLYIYIYRSKIIDWQDLKFYNHKIQYKCVKLNKY